MNASYGAEDLVRVAGRWNNPKRNYLLVDPLQAKHVPARPSASLSMMGAMAGRAAASAPGCRLVVGFAETATAMGAAAALAMGPECVYVHTTREPLRGPRLEFLEEHSHAAEQVLSLAGLEEVLAGTGSVVFVDDELTTGKTLLNAVSRMREALPGMAGKKLVAACAVDRLDGDCTARLAEAGIQVASLVHGLPYDPSERAAAYAVTDPGKSGPSGPRTVAVDGLAPAGDPRGGVRIGEYARGCMAGAARILEKVSARYPAGSRIRVVGTEECMYPALAAAAVLEMAGYEAYCHATTRSPIGVCADPGYPVRSSARMPSPYGPDRTTYLYCLEPMDAAVVVSDAPFRDLGWVAAALPEDALAFTYG